MTTLAPRISAKKIVLNQLKQLLQSERFGAPCFHRLDSILNVLGNALENGTMMLLDLEEIADYYPEGFLTKTLHGRGLTKPNGYPGDYLLLDHIYTHYRTTDPRFGGWDDYFQLQAASFAVRNRKEYFKNVVASRACLHSNIDVLNIVSGSGRELAELYDSHPDHSQIKTTCVEIDVEAIAYSKSLNKDHLDNIAYVHSNIFRYKNDRKRDMVWSAGLFDYLSEKAFVMLLKRFGEWLKPGGEIVVGNYNEAHNPTRNYLEILGDWCLLHRTREELFELGQKAGFRKSQITVENEAENVILFLRIKV